MLAAAFQLESQKHQQRPTASERSPREGWSTSSRESCRQGETRVGGPGNGIRRSDTCRRFPSSQAEAQHRASLGVGFGSPLCWLSCRPWPAPAGAPAVGRVGRAPPTAPPGEACSVLRKLIRRITPTTEEGKTCLEAPSKNGHEIGVERSRGDKMATLSLQI